MWLTLWISLAVGLVLTAIGLALVWLLPRKIRPTWVRLIGGAVLLFALWPLSIAGYLAACWMIGPPAETAYDLAPGVHYHRLVNRQDPPQVWHILEIDLTTGHRFVVTPPTATPAGPRNLAHLPAEALDQLKADLVVNASFFRPFRDEWFLDYYPHPGDVVEPVGAVIADGVAYGRPADAWPSFCVQDDGRIVLAKPDDQTRHAVTGNRWILRDGLPADNLDPDRYPRTAAAIDAAGQTVWLIVVDGKQPGYSQGASLLELADRLTTLGASDAINLDGGGSSVLAQRHPDGSTSRLSRPAHTKIPRRARPIANYLGLRFAHLTTTE